MLEGANNNLQLDRTRMVAVSLGPVTGRDFALPFTVNTKKRRLGCCWDRGLWALLLSAPRV